MKRIKSVFWVLLIMVSCISACRKDNSRLIASSSSLISFKVDGVVKKASGATKAFAFAITESNKVRLQILGEVSATEDISFIIENFNGVGEYNLVPQSNTEETTSALYQTGEDPLKDYYISESGSIKITTSTTKLLKGTFQFVGKVSPNEAKLITEGTFEVALIQTQ